MHQLATAVASNQVCDGEPRVLPMTDWCTALARVVTDYDKSRHRSTHRRRLKLDSSPSVRPSVRPTTRLSHGLLPIKHRRLPADLLADDNQNNYLLSIVLRRRRHQFISIGPLPRETRVYVSNKDRSTATKQNNSQRIVRALSVIQPLPETGNAQIGMTYLLQFYT